VNLCNTSSTDYVKGIGRLSVNFYVEYAMKGKNVQNPKGKVTLVVISNNKPDGAIDNIPHYYVIKSNAIASLNITAPTATFSGKANIAEYNPLTNLSTSIEGNCQMVLDLKDGSQDQVGITIQRNGGGIWYSNNWVSTKTVMVNVCSGDLTVSGAPVGDVSIVKIVQTISAKTAITESVEPVPFNVIAYANPSNDQFKLVIEGGSNEKVEVKGFDLLGRLVKVINKNDAQPTLFGEDLPAGSYMTVINQGIETKTVRLIKK
jgi:hypothetical protein